MIFQKRISTTSFKASSSSAYSNHVLTYHNIPFVTTYLPTYTSKMSNFHHTAEGPSIHVHEGRFLRCRIAREDGEYVDAEMDLNCCIGNDNGRFQWGGQSKSTRQLVPRPALAEWLQMTGSC